MKPNTLRTMQRIALIKRQRIAQLCAATRRQVDQLDAQIASLTSYRHEVERSRVNQSQSAGAMKMGFEALEQVRKSIASLNTEQQQLRDQIDRLLDQERAVTIDMRRFEHLEERIHCEQRAARNVAEQRVNDELAVRVLQMRK